MQRMNKMVLGLIAVFVLGGSLVLLGCGGDDDENTTEIKDAATAAALLGGKTFVFADGTVFGVTPPNTQTTLAFNTGATRFSVTNATTTPLRTAKGAVTYGSCIFTVGSSSTNPDGTVAPIGGTSFPSGTGPQANQVFTANPCTFNSDGPTLTITIGATTATSTSTGTTPSTGSGAVGG